MNQKHVVGVIVSTIAAKNARRPTGRITSGFCKQVVEAAKQVAVSSEHRRLEIANRRFFSRDESKVRPAKYTIPPYHEEYKKVYAEREHFEYLWFSWLSNSSTNADDDLDFLRMDMENQADLIKRWGGYVPREFLMKSPQPGDVMRERPVSTFWLIRREIKRIAYSLINEEHTGPPHRLSFREKLRIYWVCGYVSTYFRNFQNSSNRSSCSHHIYWVR